MNSPFASFWMGGFEGADHVNGEGVALDMNDVTGHVTLLEDDHRRAAAMGIRTLRESIGWRLAEPAPGRFDLTRLLRTAASAERHGIQPIWTLMHYGTPPDVSLLDDRFVERFVRFAVTVAEALAPLSLRPPVYNLVNEIGFLAWAACATNLMHPYRGEEGIAGESREHTGYSIKRRLVRATLAAMDAVRAVDPRARFLHVEPMIHVVAPHGRPDLHPLADALVSYQWQVWDMLDGRSAPELGGTPDRLDLVGINYYHDSQWEAETAHRLHWHRRDPRRLSLARLLHEAWARYRRPMILAETSHVGDGRAAWLNQAAADVQRVRREGVPIDGICLYPLIDRPDWTATTQWHHRGLWEGRDADRVAPAEPCDEAEPPRHLTRVLCTDYAQALRRWQQHLSTNPPPGMTMPCLIVFSHLRWNFVYQRPQHLMTRLSRHYRVLFVEEPVHDDGPARLDRIAHGPNLEVLVPHTPVAAPGFHDDQLAVLQGLLANHLEAEAIDDLIAWFYTPMALPLLAPLGARAVVYDCMDELSAFDHAPRQLRQRETALLRLADLVLTGGPALYEAKRSLHPNVHCLPSSVDAAHFSPDNLLAGSQAASEVDALQGQLPRPRLGFFGVIDERFDLALLAQLADAHPDWQLVMVGPVVKIDQAQLPRHANIHWLGMQPYARLPYFLAGWDVCLMPFALNDATRFISPTKTLEYMAGQRPIVGTPVHDVVGLYGDTVRIAAAGPAFVAACEEALAEDASAWMGRLGAMLATVDRSSWDKVGERVHELLDETVRTRPGLAPSRVGAGAALGTPLEPYAELQPARLAGS
jgi:UDP-galactopyranose mutase